MSKKLTLRLDEDVIERAKAYAAERDTSVSQLVENYFAAVMENEAPDPSPLTPLTKRLIERAPTESDVGVEDYYEYLEEKHQ